MKKKIISVILAFACVFSCFRPLTLVAEDSKTTGIGLKDVVLWGMPGTEKVYKDISYDSDYYKSYKTDAKIELVMAKGEYEGGQIIISANSDVTFDASGSALTSGENTIAADDVEIFAQKYINVSENYDSKSKLPVAKYPDALVPMANLKAVGENVVKKGENQGLYVRVKTTTDQVPGEYTGNIALSIGEEITQIPVRVQVADVTVSQEVHNKNVFANAWYFYEGELDSTQEMLDKYNEALLDYRIGMGTMLMYGSGHYEDLSTPEQREAWVEKAYGYMQNPACSTIRMPYDANIEKMTEIMQSIANYSIANNYDMFAKLVVYPGGVIDEPSGNGTMEEAKRICSSFESLKNTFADTLSGGGIQAKMAESVRKLPMIVTEHYNQELDNAGATFCPGFQYYNTADLRTQYEGQERWWYGCISPHAPYPTYHTDDTWLSARLIGWMQAQYNVVGNLYWATDVYAKVTDDRVYHSIEEYYEGDASRFPEVNGDGYLFYPGKKYDIDGPIGSMRLEAIRDGYEEYEILYEIKQRYQNGDTSLSRFGSDFDQFTNTLTKDMYVGTQVYVTTDEFRAARCTLLEAGASNKEMVFSLLDDSDNSSEEMSQRVDGLSIRTVAGSDALKQSDASTGKSAPAVKASTQSEVLLADFEEWAPDFQTLRIRNEFGSINVNKDSAYVKSGKQSAALTVVGSKKDTKPLFFANTVSTWFGYDYSDFSRIESVSAWFYNASDTEEKLHVGLITDIPSIEQADLQKYDTFTLKPGWNEVVYEPDMNYIISSVGEDSYRGIQGVYFMFDNPHAATKADGKRFYVDDVTLHYGEENHFTQVRTGSFYGSGTKIGDPSWIVLEHPIKMTDLKGKALHFEFKFDTDKGKFGFAICCNDNQWSNITGTLIIEKTANGVTANMGRIIELDDGWYAWELYSDMFKGDGKDTAKDVSLIYHQNEVVQGNVIIDWASMCVADTEKYTDGDLIDNDFSKDVSMADLENKVLEFEFKFASETGRFGFALMSNAWKNVTGTLVIEKKDGEITSNIGKIVETRDGWYAWQLERELFAGDGVAVAQEVGLAYHDNGTHDINTTVQGTVYIDWESVRAADIQKYTDTDEIYQDFHREVPMMDLEGKALQFEFQFLTDTGKFGFTLMDNKWKNITGTILIEKKNGEITSNIGRIVEIKDGWYAWRLNHELFAGNGAAKAKEVGLAYHNKEMGIDTTVQGAVYINWESMKAVDAYTTTREERSEELNDGSLIWHYFYDDGVSMSDLSGKALQFEFKFASEEGKFGFAFMDNGNGWANITGTLVIEKKDGKITSNIGRIEEKEDGWYAWKLNHALFDGSGAEKANIVDLAYHDNGTGGIDTTVKGKVYIDWKSMCAADASKEPIVYRLVWDMEPYRGSTKTAPKVPTGYVFAGWYKEDPANPEFDGYSPLREEEADAVDYAYAKFVDENVLRVKFQLRADTKSDDPYTALRMITTVDSLAYRSVGFEINFNGKHIERESRKVYKTVHGYTSNGEKLYTPSEAFACEISQYFMSYQITNIPNQYFSESFTITPTWKTLDGTVVTGSTREVAIQDAYIQEFNAENIKNDNVMHYFHGAGVSMADLEGKALQFEFQITSDTGKFDFDFMDNDTEHRDWLNVTGTLEIKKENGRITSNIGRIAETGNGWYIWKLNRSEFAGDGWKKEHLPQKVDLVYQQRKGTWQGDMLINWGSLCAADAYVVRKNPETYTNKEIYKNFNENVITKSEWKDKALHLEFMFTTDTGNFEFNVGDLPNWKNLTGKVRIEKRPGGIVACDKGRIVMLGDGWYAWELDSDQFVGDGAGEATGVGVFFADGVSVTGEILIDWDSLRAVAAYQCNTREDRAGKYISGSQIYQKLGDKAVPMTELTNDKALQFEFKITTETGYFRLDFADFDKGWANITHWIEITKKNGEITTNNGKIEKSAEDGWYTYTINKAQFGGDGQEKAQNVNFAWSEDNYPVQGEVYIDWDTVRVVDKQ